MSYASIMVHIEPGQSNAGLLNVTADIAQQFHSRVIGIAAGQPMRPSFNDGYVPPEIIEDDRGELADEIAKAEVEFRDALRKRIADIEWRSTIMFGSLADYVAGEARSVDLIVTRAGRTSLLEASDAVNASDLVMRLGRPMLVVPASADELKIERVIVAWKDTREARRAALDALPLLMKAKHISIIEIAEEEERARARARLDDVAAWLKQHCIEAQSLTFRRAGEDATKLASIAQEQKADIIVAGAYGHSSFGERVFGGATRDYLLAADRCVLISH